MADDTKIVGGRYERLSFGAPAWRTGTRRDEPHETGCSPVRGSGMLREPAAMTSPATRFSPDAPLNAFSVDVEDWYQVADFDAVVPFDRWDAYESRVRRNTDQVLALLEEYGVKGTFFVLTWNAERWPEVVRT